MTASKPDRRSQDKQKLAEPLHYGTSKSAIEKRQGKGAKVHLFVKLFARISVCVCVCVSHAPAKLASASAQLFACRKTLAAATCQNPKELSPLNSKNCRKLDSLEAW